MGNGKVAGFSGDSVVVQYTFGRGFMSSLSVAKASSHPQPGHELVELISKRGNKRRAYASIGSMQATSSELNLPQASAEGASASSGVGLGIAAKPTHSASTLGAVRTMRGSYKRPRQEEGL